MFTRIFPGSEFEMVTRRKPMKRIVIFTSLMLQPCQPLVQRIPPIPHSTSYFVLHSHKDSVLKAAGGVAVKHEIARRMRNPMDRVGIWLDRGNVVSSGFAEL